MDDLTIRPLPALYDSHFALLDSGYSTTEVYAISKVEAPDLTVFELRLTTLALPFAKHYLPPDDATRDQYALLARDGHVFGAYAGYMCVGVAVTEPQAWNRSLWVHDFHVAPAHHRRGVGRRLMERVIASARAQGLRCVVCETQNTNVPAIRFYRTLGYTLDGLDLSSYSNYDRERGEIAVYMKLPLADWPSAANATIVTGG